MFACAETQRCLPPLTLTPQFDTSTKNAPVPLHDQIKEQILGLIHAGRLKAGDQLPTMRALSIELAVNFNTVALAYRELDSQGLDERQFPEDRGRRMRGNGVGAGGQHSGKDRLFV